MEDYLEDSGKQRSSPTFTMYSLAIVSQMTAFIEGFEKSSVSTAILLLQDIGYMRLTSVWKELIIAIPMATAVLSPLIAAWFCDKFGRKKCVLMTSLFFIMGAIVSSSAYSREVLLIGRLLTGLAYGFNVTSMYVAEISHRQQRGWLIGISSPLALIGAITASLLSVVFSNDRLNGWRYIWAFQGILGLAQFIGMLFLPESPRWFILKSRSKEAKESLVRVRKDGDVEEELWEIGESFKVIQSSIEKSGGDNLYLRMFKTRSVRRALMTGFKIHILSRMSGEIAILYYAGIIIQMSTVGNMTTVFWNTVMIGCVSLVSAIVGMRLVDRIGRRPMAIVGLFGLFLGNFWLGTTFFMIAKHSPLAINTDDALNNTCSLYSRCDDCIRDVACGFCYEDIDYVMNGTCLQVSDTSHLTSKVGACNSSLTLSKYSMVWRYRYCPVTFSWLAIMGLALYIVFFAGSIGPLPWIINAEIFPLWARSTAFGITSMLAMTCYIISSVLFLNLIEAIHDYGVFYLVSFVAFIGSLICYFSLPETKDKSLEEIELLFSSNKRSI